MQYDGFLSYATTSDYQNARKIESFLESFHKLSPPAGAVIRRLQICRDGSDFTLPKRARDVEARAANNAAPDEDPIWQIILAQLQQAKYLLVLCSSAATRSRWVAREVDWFIRNRGSNAVLLLVTEAIDPVDHPGECFAENVLAAGIHTGQIWYDLRGYRGKTRDERVRDREDELVRLASDLLDWDSDAFGPLSTLWQRQQLKARRRQATVAIGVGVALILLAGVATWKAVQARRDALRARVASLVTTARAEIDPATSGLLLREVSSLTGGEATYGATNLAMHVAGLPRPRAVLRGHQGAVVTVAYNHRGDKLLTASQDGTARIWSADLNGVPTVLTGSGAGLVEATFSHDDKFILTASVDGTARIWRTDGGSGPVILQGHRLALHTSRFCADDRRVVTASDDGTVRLWSVTGGPGLAVFQEHGSAVNSAQFNRACDLVVTASDDGTSRVWSPNGTTAPVKFGFPGQLKFSSAQWSPDETQVLVASSEGTGWIWSPTQKFPFITLTGASTPVSWAIFSPNGQWIGTSQVSQVSLWQVSQLSWVTQTNQSKLSFDAGSPVRKIVFSPDSTKVAAAAQDGSTRVWTINSDPEPLMLGWHEGPVLDVTFSPDGSRLATASADSTARIWDVLTPTEPRIADLHRGPIWSVQLLSDATRALTRTKDGTLWLWRWEGDRFVQTSHSDTAVASAHLSVSGKHIAIVDQGVVQVVDAERMSPLFQLPLSDPSVRVAAVNGNATVVVTIAGQGSVHLWRVGDLKNPVALDGYEGDVYTVRFSPDGSHLVTTGSDRSVRVWRTADPRNPMIFQGHQATVRDALFSQDGRYVVSVSDDGTARVWDVSGKMKPRVLGGHSGPVLSAAFSEEASRVITGSIDQAKVWTLDAPDLPIELQVPGGAVWAVAFTRDGSQAIAATNDGRLLSWHTDWRWLAADVEHWTRACLSSDQRMRLLGEPYQEATVGYAKCERSIGQAR